jgi:hypothetical protein
MPPITAPKPRKKLASPKAQVVWVVVQLKLASRGCVKRLYE